MKTFIQNRLPRIATSAILALALALALSLSAGSTEAGSPSRPYVHALSFSPAPRYPIPPRIQSAPNYHVPQIHSTFTPSTTVPGSFTVSPHLKLTPVVVPLNSGANNGTDLPALVPPASGPLNVGTVVVGNVAPLAGSQQTGRTGRLEFQFFPKTGQVTMTDDVGTVTGSFTLPDNKVEMSFYNGALIYKGEIYGDSISGVGSMGATNWSFSVKNESFNFTQLHAQ